MLATVLGIGGCSYVSYVVESLQGFVLFYFAVDTGIK